MILGFLAKSRSLSKAKVLVAAGADVNAKDLFGSTPLHMAATDWSIKKF